MCVFGSDVKELSRKGVTKTVFAKRGLNLRVF